MATIKEFEKIAEIAGVKSYILVKNNGSVAARQIEEPERIARIVLRCGQNSDAIGVSRFRYLVLARENRENFIIFPIGNYYLGVVKEKNIDSMVLVNSVLDFFENLPGKRSSAQSPGKSKP